MEKRFFEDLAGKVADIFIEREVGKKLRLFEENAKLYGNDEAKTCVRCKTLFLMAESGESCPCPNCQTMWCMRECCVGEEIKICGVCLSKTCSFHVCQEEDCNAFVCYYCSINCSNCERKFCASHIIHLFISDDGRYECAKCLSRTFPEHKRARKR